MILVVGAHVNPTTYSHTTGIVVNWAIQEESRYVCIANVHVLMEAYDSCEFREKVNKADLVVPDGMPLVWMMHAKGQYGQTRVYGPTLMLHMLEAAARDNIPVGFYGGA